MIGRLNYKKFLLRNDQRMVYLSTYEHPLYYTSDLCIIRYTILPTYSQVVLQVLVGHVATAPGPLACPSRGARPLSLS